MKGERCGRHYASLRATQIEYKTTIVANDFIKFVTIFISKYRKHEQSECITIPFTFHLSPQKKIFPISFFHFAIDIPNLCLYNNKIQWYTVRTKTDRERKC